MSLEMVHSNKGEPARERDGLASRHPYDQTADQARTRRGRAAADFTQAKPSFGERFGNATIEQLDMRARGDLRHHAAELRMEGELRAPQIGKETALTSRV